MKIFRKNWVLLFLMSFLPSIQAEDIPEEREVELGKLEEVHKIIIEVEPQKIENHEQLLLKPVVQFSCARAATPQEDAWEADLKGKNSKAKLDALGTLVNLSAPSSVPLQYKAYKELKKKYKNNEIIEKVAYAFGEKRIKTILARKPEKEKYERPNNEFVWCIRAVGVLQMKDCIPRLLELSKCNNLGTYLAAERSIRDLKGKEAEDALIKVISFWKYNAYVKAGDEMLKRNKEKLGKALLKMEPPENCEYQYAILLARTGNPKAVPILCKTVGKIAMIDYSMFCFIAELGLPEHKGIILDLPNHVRKNQQDMAKECIEKYLKKMEKLKNNQ